MSSTGVVASGGVGKNIAEWIIDGEPSINLEAHDILRFVPFHNNRRFLRERVKESLGRVYLGSKMKHCLSVIASTESYQGLKFKVAFLCCMAFWG